MDDTAKGLSTVRSVTLLCSGVPSGNCKEMLVPNHPKPDLSSSVKVCHPGLRQAKCSYVLPTL